MSLYRVTLTTKHAFTRLPDSQTLFGAMSWGIIDLYTEDVFLKMMAQFKSKTPPFILSNVYPKGVLPAPQLSFRSELMDLKTIFPYLKKFKKIKYFSEAVMRDYLKHPDFSQQLLTDLLNQYIKKQSIQSYYYDEKKQVVYKANETVDVPKIQTEKVLKNSLNRISGETTLYYHYRSFVIPHSQFNFFIETDEIEKLKPVLNYLSDTGIGPDKTIGMNHFEVLSVEQVEPFENQLSGKFLISKYVPCEEDLEWDKLTEPSYLYKLESYQRHLETRGQFFHDFKAKRVTMFAEGSLLPVTSTQAVYGRLVPVQEIASQTIYQNGYGFFI